MSFFNPLSFLLFLSIHGVNLFQMNAESAKELSGTYTLVNTREAILPNSCPDTFDMEFIPSDNPDLFVLKNKVQFNGSWTSKARRLPIDGQSRSLPNGQIMKGEVTQPNAIAVEILNPRDPGEKLVETFEFNKDGSFVYKTEHIVKSPQIASFDGQCSPSTYKKVL